MVSNTDKAFGHQPYQLQRVGEVLCLQHQRIFF